MVLVLFRNRLNPGVDAEYGPRADEILALARRQPGFVSFHSYTAEDGTRLAVSAFESLEHAEAWGREAEHRIAQQQGREHFYAEYELRICEQIRESHFRR